MYSEENNKSPFVCLVAWLADSLAGEENYADLGASKLDIGMVACITQWECCSGSVTLLLLIWPVLSSANTMQQQEDSISTFSLTAAADNN